MNEFLDLLPPGEALEKFLAHLSFSPQSERVETKDALGKVLAMGISAPFSLPAFPRSTVDGFAVISAYTHGASESLPAYLKTGGEVRMGEETGIRLSPGTCALIHTGGMLPKNADAVVMVEHTQASRDGEIEVLRAVAPGENVIQVGEDVQAGEEIVSVGKLLRPAEIGGLMALGLSEVEVHRQPRVGIISSGDEVVSPGVPLNPGQVYDINSYTLAGLVGEVAGEPVHYGIAADNYEDLREKSAAAAQECDLVVLTAGSSLSSRDLTAVVINSLGKPGVIVHGVNVRPGKPTILGVCDGKAMIGLPGNPASALVIARLFVVPVIEALLGRAQDSPRPQVGAAIRTNIASASGREDFVPVRLQLEPDGIVAIPLFGKSNLIFTLVKADGLVHIDADSTGLAAGEVVTVELF